MPLSTLRRRLVDAPDSMGESARRRRWEQFTERFPDLAEMSVLDLGGTPAFWDRAPVVPSHVTLLNMEDGPTPSTSGIEAVFGDACDPPEAVSARSFDLVFSNSTIEHVGGHSRREDFAAVVREAAPRHWIQTPYRYFLVEPHWLFPGFQFLPTPVRAQLTMRWPLTHTRSKTWDNAVATVCSTELLGKTELRHYFPESELERERVLGLSKSIIAVKASAV